MVTCKPVTTTSPSSQIATNSRHGIAIQTPLASPISTTTTSGFMPPPSVVSASIIIPTPPRTPTPPISGMKKRNIFYVSEENAGQSTITGFLEVKSKSEEVKNNWHLDFYDCVTSEKFRMTVLQFQEHLVKDLIEYHEYNIHAPKCLLAIHNIVYPMQWHILWPHQALK